MKYTSKNIRNFCIIAHIDHGKSTLADRFIEITKTLTKREMSHGQMLDTMDLEQERGITIKLQPIHMKWKQDNQEYILNLIDTPGHVDFSYEVSRSLAACEGAILVIDASQGIQAQTLANCYMAMDHNLKIIPVLNKIDLPSADIETRAKEIENTLGVPKEEIVAISAKEGTNVDKVIEKIIAEIPAPKDSDIEGETKALIFDSVYDVYKGIVSYIKVEQGSIKKGDKVFFMHTQSQVEVLDIGHFKPKYVSSNELLSGDVGYIVTGVKSVRDAKVGDTVWKSGNSGLKIDQAKPLAGYKEVTPFVYAGLFTVEGKDYNSLRDAIEKLQLNDASFSFEPESSSALGHGFRCGFLGLLHMEIIQERLEREFSLNLIVTAPSVGYKIITTKMEEVNISNPNELPDRSLLSEISEPWVAIEILTPKDYTGATMQLVTEKRGTYKNMEYIEDTRVLLKFELPLASLIIDFYDKLKSISKGYASLNYEMIGYKAGDLVKLDILIAGNIAGPLSMIVHRSEAFYLGRDITKKLKELIPRSNFEIPVQAAIGAKIVARETIRAYRKDVTAKLYGGDVSRKRKLLEKQKKGKKRMKMIGNVEVPQSAFLAVLKK